MYLLIDSIPPVCFYRATDSVPEVAALCLPRLDAVGALRRPLSGSVGAGEASNITVSLDNGDGVLSRLWPVPPVRTSCTVVASGCSFSGIIAGITLNATMTLEILAGTALPLSELLPLRSTTVWGRYRTVQPIPWVYGRTTVIPVQADEINQLFCVADHPCAAVEAAWRDNVPETLYTWHNGPDATGHGCCFLRLNVPLKVNERLVVRVRGRMHETTGELLTNPAEVAGDILRSLCGIATAATELERFRAECLRTGSTVAGVLADGRATIRSTLDAILGSCGAVWSGGMPGLAKIYP